ncbi:MAG: N-acetylmuramoyl-L-alanine amidase [Sandaracinaceae bacterium]|nr:N-acetylmuramoyl-L-alanine amidase [Sandaracinaceae bacterium]
MSVALRAIFVLACVGVLSAPALAQDFPRGRNAAALVRTRGAPARRWSAIIVHHSASSRGDAASIDAYHRNVRHFSRGMAYHFLIGNGHGLGDGEIEVGPRWTHQQPGAHVASALRDPRARDAWDNIAIGICLVGDLDDSPPTPRQRATLAELVSILRRRFGIEGERVLGHGGVPGAHTACPGRRLSLTPLRTPLERGPAPGRARPTGGRGGRVPSRGRG